MKHLNNWTICGKSSIIADNLKERVNNFGPFVELFTDESILSKPVKELKDAIAKAEAIPLILHTPNWYTHAGKRSHLGLGHYDREHEDSALRIIKHCLTLAVSLLPTNQKLIVVHPCTHIYNSIFLASQQDKNTLLSLSMDNLRRSLDELLPLADQHGLTICVENMPPFVNRPEDTDALGYYYFAFPEQFNSLLHEYPTETLTTCLDTCHLEMTLRMVRLFGGFNRGLGLYSSEELAKYSRLTWNDYAKSIDRIGLVHLAHVNDIGLNPSTHGQSFTPQNIELALSLLGELENRKTRPLITLEIYEQDLRLCDNALVTYQILVERLPLKNSSNSSGGSGLLTK